MSKTVLRVRIELTENYDYRDLETILENCAIVEDVELLEEYDY